LNARSNCASIQPKDELEDHVSKVTAQEADNADPAKLPTLEALSRRDFFMLHGEVMFLLARNNLHRAYSIAEMQRRVMYPIGLGQFSIYRSDTKPLALLTWAFVTDAIDRRFRTEVADLNPEEWNSGPHLWYMDFVAPFGHGGRVINDMLTKVFPDRIGRSQRALTASERPFVVRTYYGANVAWRDPEGRT
jgi:hemolysin-activating ACP:hemolysin acyltransferase